MSKFIILLLVKLVIVEDKIFVELITQVISSDYLEKNSEEIKVTR